MDVRLLTADDEAAYVALLASRPDSLIYLSLTYRDFLVEMLPHGRSIYLVAEENGKMAGALPAFVGESAAHGKIINSLPFFGGHGGAIVAPDYPDAATVKRRLLRGFKAMAQQEGARAFTMISSPFEPDAQLYIDELQPTHRDMRISQMSPLPQGRDSDLAEQLMSSFHHKTRNMVRKGKKGSFHLRQSIDHGDLVWLQQVHEQNMIAAGAAPKPFVVFEGLRKQLGSNLSVYIAETETERVAGLIVLYFNDYAEYYTPAIVESYRNEQPLSFLIFHAMQDAVTHGARTWNWGGTAAHQDSIHRFKKRWNATDAPYHYYTRVLDQTLLEGDPRELSAAFPYFYLYPFSKAVNIPQPDAVDA